RYLTVAESGIMVLSVQDESVLCLFFFFFQAEDGIRDATVTGVQTCALPISSASASRRRSRRCAAADRRRPCSTSISTTSRTSTRSEERRVGKECRSGSSEQN